MNDSGKHDPSRVSAGQGYGVHYMAQKHGLSVERARAIARGEGKERRAANQPGD
jgi:hypothetical protein